MGHLNLLWALQFLALISPTKQEKVSIQIGLDSQCTERISNGSTGWYPRARAVNSTDFFLSELNASLELDTCCCTEKHVTCNVHTNGDRPTETLRPFFDYLNRGSYYGGTYISGIELLTSSGHELATCTGETNFSLPGNHTINHTNYNVWLAETAKLTGSADSQSGNEAKTIGGAVGGTLGALGALGALLPLSYYMYKRIKGRNQVDDANSTTDLFGTSPVGNFQEAPNSVPPAGTG